MSLIHPRLLENVRVAFPSRCSIQEATSTTADSGHVVQTWTDVPMLVGLRCQMKAASSGEVRTSDLVVTTDAFRVALLGYFPSILTTHRAVIDGTTYNIIGIDQDSQHTQTYLTVQLVTL